MKPVIAAVELMNKLTPEIIHRERMWGDTQYTYEEIIDVLKEAEKNARRMFAALAIVWKEIHRIEPPDPFYPNQEMMKKIGYTEKEVKTYWAALSYISGNLESPENIGVGKRRHTRESYPLTTWMSRIKKANKQIEQLKQFAISLKKIPHRGE